MGRWEKNKIWMTLNLYPTFQLPKTAQHIVQHNTKDEFDRLAVQVTLLCSSVLKQLIEKCVCDSKFPPRRKKTQSVALLIQAVKSYVRRQHM
jgi:hypothetical protein